jgi:hypothetical protein
VAKYRSLMDDKKFLEIDGRILAVEPGEVVDLPDTWLVGRYMQVGEYGEEPQWEAVVDIPKQDKAAKAESETKEK